MRKRKRQYLLPYSGWAGGTTSWHSLEKSINILFPPRQPDMGTRDHTPPTDSATGFSLSLAWANWALVNLAVDDCKQWQASGEKGAIPDSNNLFAVCNISTDRNSNLFFSFKNC
jgi:hypothetical protein